jgi:choline dehydrogenase-like flavoprotein
MTALPHIDGRTLTAPEVVRPDVVIVGSGPAGSASARVLARAGARAVIVEAGPVAQPDSFPIGAFASMATHWRQMGTSVVLGRAPIPYLQGRMVGGSSPINGAICWPLPREVHAEWCAADPALESALPWEEVESTTDAIEARLSVTPTDPAVAGAKNHLMARGANALGLAHRPIRRNTVDCAGLGRCTQGCPRGAKQSVDRTLLADAVEAGATLYSAVEATQLVHRRGRLRAVEARAAGGAALRFEPRVATILAASAVQSPALLLRSGIRHGPVGRHFQCHPGVSLAGRFPEPVRMWEGATQGHEVTGLRSEGMKFESLGFGLAVLSARLPGVGAPLRAAIDEMAWWCDWGVAVRARAQGRVRVVAGRTVVQFTPDAEDVRRFRRGLRVLGDMMFAAGAQRVAPGVRRFPEEVSEPRVLATLESEGPRSPAAFTAAIAHMFGTCRMGSDPGRSVVRPDFRHHRVEGLYVADSSVFPTNLGVNPQIAIMTLATLCGRRVLEAA